jgi:blue copper oxidase
LQGFAALGLAAATRPVRPGTTAPPDAADSFCRTGTRTAPRLTIPGDAGYLGRLAPRGDALTLSAGVTGGVPSALTTGPLAFSARHRGHRYANPTLVLQRGERVRITLDNALGEPTIAHWHGLTVDTRNDGNGSFLIPPGERYDYDFEVRNRAGLYWYHPHPHGRSASQTYRGLYGLILVEDDDERVLRAALDVTPGSTEIPLVLQERRAGVGYAPTPADLTHGFLGDEMLVNGAHCPYLDVATRVYRFRILNAANARTLLLAFRTADGTAIPFTLIGNDGGLLPVPVNSSQVFISTAERLDVLVDLRHATVGDTVRLETLAFDAMHAAGAMSAPAASAAMEHAMPAGSVPQGVDHVGTWPEGAPRWLLELRVRKRVRYDRRIPDRLSAIARIDTANTTERSFRLGFAKGHWRINDRVFEMGVTPIEVARGSVEAWLLRNYHTSMPHAMHLHAFAFEVQSRETSPDAVAALAVDPQGRLPTDLGRKDTVLVWPGESVRIAVDFTHPFPGPQTYLFHCHNLEHEDAGMMLGVAVK